MNNKSLNDTLGAQGPFNFKSNSHCPERCLQLPRLSKLISARRTPETMLLLSGRRMQQTGVPTTWTVALLPLTTPAPRRVPAVAAAGRGQGRLRPGPPLAPPRWTECHEVPHTLASGCHCWTRSGWLIRYFLSQTQILAS